MMAAPVGPGDILWKACAREHLQIKSMTIVLPTNQEEFTTSWMVRYPFDIGEGRSNKRVDRQGGQKEQLFKNLLSKAEGSS